MMTVRHGISALLALGLVSCANSSPGGAGDNWPGFGGQADEQHFSPLDEITDKTIDRLGLVCRSTKQLLLC